MNKRCYYMRAQALGKKNTLEQASKFFLVATEMEGIYSVPYVCTYQNAIKIKQTLII